MGRKPKKLCPSFFKVLITDFTHLLRLPPVFMQKHGLTLPRTVKLRISCGKTWNVKLEQVKEDKAYGFAQGWNKFAEDVGLEMGEFLVFQLVGKSTFDVSLYEINGCKREIPASEFQVEASDSGEEIQLSKYYKCEKRSAGDKINKKRPRPRDDGASKSDHFLKQGGPLYFEILLKSHHRGRVSLPKKFWVAAGLQGQDTVGLEYLPGHRYQAVVLDHREPWRTDMAAGWPEFLRANGLVLGKTYSFEFKPSKNVIQVKEVTAGK